MNAKTTKEALAALQSLIDNGFTVSCDKFVEQYQITVSEHAQISFNEHHHYLDDTFIGAVMKAYNKHKVD